MINYATIFMDAYFRDSESDAAITEPAAAPSDEVTSTEGTGPSVVMPVMEQAEPIIIVEDRPFLTTSFEDYTVTEGLMLALLMAVFMAVLWQLLKGGIAWLR